MNQVIEPKGLQCVSISRNMNCPYESVESGDCSVRSIQHSLGIDYVTSKFLLQGVGRKDRCGATIWQIKRAILNYAAHTDLILMDIKIPQEASVYTDYLFRVGSISRDESYIVVISKHVFAIRNGICYDWSFKKKKILSFLIIKQASKFMATDVKNLTSSERSKLIAELSDRIAKNTFTKDVAKENCIKLLNMLSRHEPSDIEEVNKSNEAPDFNLEL